MSKNPIIHDQIIYQDRGKVLAEFENGRHVVTICLAERGVVEVRRYETGKLVDAYRRERQEVPRLMEIIQAELEIRRRVDRDQAIQEARLAVGGGAT